MTQVKNQIEDISIDELKSILAKKEAEESNKKAIARKAYEELKDNTIRELVPAAQKLSEQLSQFKQRAFSDMDALYEILCSYSKRHADGKGNFSVEVASGMKITYKRQESGFFDERSQQAEKHIIDFVNSYYRDHDRTKELITSLLERKKGSLDIRLVQKLYSMETAFDDKNWHEGIRLLKESWQPSETRSYITFELKGKDGKWESINLNFASL